VRSSKMDPETQTPYANEFQILRKRNEDGGIPHCL
jgi:hypothetical protein